MKTRRSLCRTLLVLVLCGFLPAAPLLAQQYEKSRELTQVYPLSEETTVQIINKYGNVHILPWEKDSIRFEISIRVEAGKQSKLERTFSSIDIEFSESSFYVIAQTVFGNQKNSFWADVTDFTNSMLNAGSQAQIDYVVYLPENNEISIENKFGNIYMTDHSGKTLVMLSNGDFRGGSYRELELDHSFGNVNIETIVSGKLNLAYSELKLDHADELRITSKSSKPSIKSFGSLRINSRRDTYFIEEAGMVNGETSFSYLNLQSLNGDLILNANYGSLSIDGYGKNFSMMNLLADYTDVSMICRKKPGCMMEVYYDRKTELVYPGTSTGISFEDSETGEGQKLLKSKASGMREDSPRIKISIEGGSVNLIYQ